MVRQVLLDEGLARPLQGLARGLAVVLRRFLGTRGGDLLSTSRSRFPSTSQVLLFLDAIRVVEVVPGEGLDDSRGRPEPKTHDAEPLLDTSRVVQGRPQNLQTLHGSHH